MDNNIPEKLNTKGEYDQQKNERLKEKLNSDHLTKIKKILKNVFILIIILGVVYWIFVSMGRRVGNQVSQSLTNREVALKCTTDMATKFHIHPNIEIMVNGKQQELSSNIGIRLNCMNSLHTHDKTGLIHVESSEKRDFTLSDFFAVWGKTYNQNQILDYQTDAGNIIRQTVNGQEVKDYENTVLNDKDRVTIFYENKK